MKASLIVRSLTGKILYVGDPITVDLATVETEKARLRLIFGAHGYVDTTQIISARQAMEREPLVA